MKKNLGQVKLIPDLIEVKKKITEQKLLLFCIDKNNLFNFDQNGPP